MGNQLPSQLIVVDKEHPNFNQYSPLVTLFNPDGTPFASGSSENPTEDSLVFSVVDHGAVGNGSTDCTAAINATVAAAWSATSFGRGAIVYFPAGSYVISGPIVLPRTGSTPTAVVRIIGSGIRSSQIIAFSGFPANRAMIEWTPTTSKAWHQEISNISFRLPNVVGTRCVHYKKNSVGTTLSDFNNERMQIVMRDVLVEGNNQYHTSVIKLEGQVFYSKFERVYGDHQRSSLLPGTDYSPITDYDTATFEFDSDLYGEPVSSDIVGLSYSHIDSCSSGSLRRGGRGKLILGKVKSTGIDNGWCDGGRYDPGIHLINSFNVHLNNCNNEGLSATQIKMTNSHFITLDGVHTGTQDPEFPEWVASKEYTTAWGVIIPGWRTANVGAPPANNCWFKCVTAGTTGSSQPTWTNTIGATVNDGTVVWECMGPAVQDAVVIDGGQNLFLNRLSTGPSQPNYSARGCKMIGMLNSPVNVQANQCNTPDNPATEIFWSAASGFGDFTGNRNGKKVRFGVNEFEPYHKLVKTVPGRYRQPRGSTSTTRAMTQNLEFAIPIDVPAGTILDRIGINVSTPIASSVVRLGVREDNDGYPGTLLVDAGTVDSSTTGAKELPINVTTTGVRVWLCAVAQNGSGVICTGINGPVWPCEQTNFAASASGVSAAYNQSGVSGALGGFGAANGTSGTGPLIVVRIG